MAGRAEHAQIIHLFDWNAIIFSEWFGGLAFNARICLYFLYPYGEFES